VEKRFIPGSFDYPQGRVVRRWSGGLDAVLKKCLAGKRRTSAAKAAFTQNTCGTAKAVPLSKTEFFSAL
jgi:hypothetical protein